MGGYTKTESSCDKKMPNVARTLLGLSELMMYFQTLEATPDAPAAKIREMLETARMATMLILGHNNRGERTYRGLEYQDVQAAYNVLDEYREYAGCFLAGSLARSINTALTVLDGMYIAMHDDKEIDWDDAEKRKEEDY